MDHTLQDISNGPVMVMGCVHNVLLTRMRSAPPMAELQRMDRAVKALAARHNGAMASCLVVPGARVTGDPMTSEERTLAKDIMRMGGPPTLGAVVALEGTGFWMATARMVLSGIQRVANPPFPAHVADSRAAALDWLCPLLVAKGRDGVPREAIERALEQLCALPPVPVATKSALV